jgi:N-acetylglucosaminyldiphosphoundecaprenol N-acetyl-beta-D-mannosaminyltransferase
MWTLTRMTAALNRTPQVTGGYLGIVSLALLVLMKLEWTRTPPFFPVEAAAALAGAGIATVPFAIKKTDFNIGWSAALALGFLLAQIATLGLVKNAAFFMVLLSLIAFGLPLLDVSFFRLRAALRGEQVNVDEQRLRLHEALLRRGIAPSKITMLYLVGGAWMCGLGVLTARYVFGSAAPWWMLLGRAAIVGVLFFIGFIVFLSLARVWMSRGHDEVVPEEIEAFGVRISAVSMNEALDKIEGFIREGTPHHVVTSDANAILRAQEDEEYAGIIRRAALITPDGFGVVWGARLLNLPIYERVTGVDMVTGICERAAQNNWSIYILGSEPGIAATAAEKLAARYPGLRIAGTQRGFWKRDGIADEEIVQCIQEAKPEVLFVAFGIPAQEKFIARHFNELNVPVSLGVGGSFDVYSEKLRRAPEYIQRSGLEWLYRVWQEPWRWKRMSYVPRFMAFALRTWLFGKRAPQAKH